MITIEQQINAVIEAIITGEDLGKPKPYIDSLRAAVKTLMHTEQFARCVQCTTDEGETLGAQF